MKYTCLGCEHTVADKKTRIELGYISGQLMEIISTQLWIVYLAVKWQVNMIIITIEIAFRDWLKDDLFLNWNVWSWTSVSTL